MKTTWSTKIPAWLLKVVPISLAIIIGLSASVLAQYDPPHEEPGPAVERLYFKAFNVDRAPLDLEAGEMDLYYFNLKIAAARELRDKEGIQLYEAPASTISLILNPAPAPEGRLNPFSIKEVRQAMQRLVDREFVTREIYQGQAAPMYTNVASTDYDYLTVFDVIQQAELGYDPEYARQLIADAMTEAGAELVDGVWHFNEQPIRLKFIMRVEDERREVGDLIRAALQDAGFAIAANRQSFAPAIQTVYATDPAQFEWHLYTEGWGRGAPNRYDFGGINSFYAPWLGNMPGWKEVGFWHYENEELDDLGERLFKGEFADQAERDDMYREMTRIGLDESVRIWIATVMNAFPVQAGVEGITQDLAAGPRGLWSLRSAYKAGTDELTVGHLWVWTERTTWNPVGGFGDVYSNDIWRHLQDPAVWNDPFTGIPAPFRIDYEVETAGPEGALDVPADAIMWNTQRGRWTNVGEDVTATSKVVYDYSKYFQAPWHHGQAISMADVLYSIYQGFDLSYNPDKAKIETVIATTARPFLDTIKGYRVLDENRIEAYVDFWHFEQNYIASYGIPAGLSTPWEMLYAMDELVFGQRRAAYSDTAAARYNVPWISLVLDRDARLVRKAMLDLRRLETIPTDVFTLPTADGEMVLTSSEEGVERYTAVLEWFDEKGHMVISNGPFMLQRYDPPAQFAELVAFRDESYPFTASDLYRGLPDLIEYTEIEAPPIELGADYEVTLTLDGPGNLSLRYLLIDTASGDIIQQGDADTLDPNWFAIRMTAETTDQLELGIYELVLVAYSDELARMAERRIELEADIAIIGEEPAAEETESSDTESSETEEASSSDSDEESSEAAVEEEESESETEEKSDEAESDTESDSESDTETESESAEDESEEVESEPAGGLPVNPVVGAVVIVIILGGILLARRRR
ncbi:MAG: ABC transporter substrate-binding protein [Caldilineaceae bacterium]|nr:ABC transporter substrate-binding protein [Caldilineaceae bacterium]MDE0339974.1 ABC transporter substrate-binding protein [Caldilineaceae bacterium]